LFHKFLTAAADQAMLELIKFLNNIAISGRRLMNAPYGAGSWSMVSRREPGACVLAASVPSARLP
jgi:hypothetical protein